MVLSQSQSKGPGYWPSARHFTEAMQCPGVCFNDHKFRQMLPAVDRLGMPLVTSGQFAYVYKLKSRQEARDYAVRCFRGYLGDRDQRYRAIQQHLRNHHVSFISEFHYEPEGILVGGNRYPIISMNWIEGPTLDLYLDNMINRRDVLLHLADEWLRLVRALRDAGVAHGDLQHGNIIIQHGNLCLIDHDGIFVPAMAGWSSSEVGHQHFQHPRRDARHFDSNLDNFSAIVIYLTLISLAEKPDLWKEYHDENLIFTKTDFAEPTSSSLLREIREIGPEHARLVTVLEEATYKEPEAVPCVLDLVTAKTALPSWMTAPADLETKTKTREVVHDQALTEGTRWIPWQAKRSASNVPATPSSSTVQTLFGPPVTLQGALSNIRDPQAVFRNTAVFGKELLGRTFLWWYWGLYLFLKFIGLDFIYAFALAVFCLAAVTLTYGFVRAQQVARAALQPKSPLTGNVMPVTNVGAWQKSTLAPSSITVPEPIIGNAALSIYHRTDCDWVKHISPKNRIGFSSSSEASSAGFKACQVCSTVS